MSTTYGPKTSPFGRNEALDRLAAQLEQGQLPANLATANRVIEAVEHDDRITTEESQTLDRIWKAALGTESGVEGATPFGRDLLMNFSKIARTRLFATQANRSSDPMNQLISMWSWGTISVKPSYVAVDQNPLGGTKDKASTDAMRKTLDDRAGKWDLIRLVEKSYPKAIDDPGHTHQAPTLQPDVEAAYQSLRAEIMAGQVDENDPLSPMKTLLDANYT